MASIASAIIGISDHCMTLDLGEIYGGDRLITLPILLFSPILFDHKISIGFQSEIGILYRRY